MGGVPLDFNSVPSKETTHVDCARATHAIHVAWGFCFASLDFLARLGLALCYGSHLPSMVQRMILGLIGTEFGTYLASSGLALLAPSRGRFARCHGCLYCAFVSAHSRECSFDSDLWRQLHRLNERNP